MYNFIEALGENFLGIFLSILMRNLISSLENEIKTLEITLTFRKLLEL